MKIIWYKWKGGRTGYDVSNRIGAFLEHCDASVNANVSLDLDRGQLAQRQIFFRNQFVGINGWFPHLLVRHDHVNTPSEREKTVALIEHASTALPRCNMRMFQIFYMLVARSIGDTYDCERVCHHVVRFLFLNLSFFYCCLLGMLNEYQYTDVSISRAGKWRTESVPLYSSCTTCTLNTPIDCSRRGELKNAIKFEFRRGTADQHFSLH
jgi:hypothetical protein